MAELTEQELREEVQRLRDVLKELREEVRRLRASLREALDALEDYELPVQPAAERDSTLRP